MRGDMILEDEVEMASTVVDDEELSEEYVMVKVSQELMEELDVEMASTVVKEGLEVGGYSSGVDVDDNEDSVLELE